MLGYEAVLLVLALGGTIAVAFVLLSAVPRPPQREPGEDLQLRVAASSPSAPPGSGSRCGFTWWPWCSSCSTSRWSSCTPWARLFRELGWGGLYESACSWRC